MAYLDHAATTPMLPAAIAAMSDVMARVGNPSSLHASGRRARRAVEEARESVGESLNARPSEVIFTSGGTESDNLAVKGMYWAARDADPDKTVVLASAVEHHAVLDSVEWLAAHEGAQVVWLPVDDVGRVSPEVFATALDAHAGRIALASVMWANNEIGTIQPVAELAALAEQAGVPMHTDAVQAVGTLPVRFDLPGLTALTAAGHKIGGPVGTGVLLLDRDAACVPLAHGGGQERDVRSGTLDVAGIVGFATALAETVADRDRLAVDLGVLRDELIAGVRAAVPDAVLNGDPKNRLAGNAHFSFSGCEGDALLMLLDARGIECSTGSACSAGVAQPSHVLLALGADIDRARGSLRFSLGHTSSAGDVAELTGAIAGVVERARRAG